MTLTASPHLIVKLAVVSKRNPRNLFNDQLTNRSTWVKKDGQWTKVDQFQCDCSCKPRVNRWGSEMDQQPATRI